MAFSIPKAKRDIKTKENNEEVGPGLYNPKSIGKKSEPQWGFGTESRNLGYKVNDHTRSIQDLASKENNESSAVKDHTMYGGLKLYDKAHTITVPGPGSYNVDDVGKFYNIQSTKFGHEDRFNASPMKKGGVPGPGQYAFDNLEKIKQATPNVKFGSSSRSPSNGRPTTPGPGAYNHKNVIGQDGPSKSMGLKPSVEVLEKEAARVPGPGAYTPNIDAQNKSPPKYRIGTSQRNDFTKRNRSHVEPGPGNYNPSDTFVKTNGEQWRFGTEHQRPTTGKSSSNSPGPGNYNPRSEVGKNKSPQYRIGTSQRFDFTMRHGTQQKPGPGNYTPGHTLTQTKSETWGFGTQKRPGSNNKLIAANPGPDHYNIPSKLQNGPKYVMGIKFSDAQEKKKMMAVPGPGQYEVKPDKFSDANMVREPQYKIGTAQRGGHYNLKNSRHTPGPANYNTIDSASHVRKSSPNYRIGSAQRMRDFQDRNASPPMVGPGSYEAKKVVGEEGIKSSMALKLEPKQTNSRNVPGPGQYETTAPAKSLMKSMPSWVMGSSKRPASSVSKDQFRSPSPAQYSPDHAPTDLKAATYVFGKESRIPPSSKDVVFFPGPGSYTLPPKYKQPRFAMGIKFKDSKRGENPGPGQYENLGETTRAKSPSYTMTGKASRNASPARPNGIPGPGQYKVGGEKAVEGPKYGFGTSQRGRQRSPETPGPGQYRIPSKIQDLPTYALPSRKDEFKFI